MNEENETMTEKDKLLFPGVNLQHIKDMRDGHTFQMGSIDNPVSVRLGTYQGINSDNETEYVSFAFGGHSIMMESGTILQAIELLQTAYEAMPGKKR